MNTKPMMVHMMLVFGHERALGAREAFDVTAHVLPIFHLRASYEITLFANLSFSEAFISPVQAVLRIRAGSTKKRFVGLLRLGFPQRERGAVTVWIQGGFEDR